MRLSIVIPAYNEEQRIGDTLRDIEVYLSREPYEAEIIVVDDGSKDATPAIVQASFPEVRLLSYRPNRGKGHAVKAGMLAARGDYRLFCDADESTPIREIEKFWPRFEAGADIVIGSRSLPESDVVVHQPRWRENMGRTFNLALRMLMLTHFPDTQCGFKAFSARACETVFPRQTVERYSFDVELLFIAETHGLRIEQTPIRWINCPQTRVSPFSDAPRMLLDVLAIRFKAMSGRYA